MPEIPEYRLRLFMSVDLVGSTAFKAKESSQIYEAGKIKPMWVSAFTAFYNEFPRLVRSEFDKGISNLSEMESENFPRIWKTIGDELILCSRAVSLEHLSHSVASFVSALKEYSVILKKRPTGLGVKGNAWVAACPAPNIGFALDPWPELHDSGLETSEKIETIIDSQPHRFDFLGKAIDTGFRISKNSRADRCTISVQLAYALSQAKLEDEFKYVLGCDGRVELKGVNDGIPYPVLFIYTETDSARKTLQEKEFAILGAPRPSAQQLLEFLDSFMTVAGIEKPYIGFRRFALSPTEKPETFKNFELALSKVLEGLEIQDATYEDAELKPAEVGEDSLDAGELDQLLAGDEIDLNPLTNP